MNNNIQYKLNKYEDKLNIESQKKYPNRQKMSLYKSKLNQYHQINQNIQINQINQIKMLHGGNLNDPYVLNHIKSNFEEINENVSKVEEFINKYKKMRINYSDTAKYGFDNSREFSEAINNIKADEFIEEINKIKYDTEDVINGVIIKALINLVGEDGEKENYKNLEYLNDIYILHTFIPDFVNYQNPGNDVLEKKFENNPVILTKYKEIDDTFYGPLMKLLKTLNIINKNVKDYDFLKIFNEYKTLKVNNEIDDVRDYLLIKLNKINEVI